MHKRKHSKSREEDIQRYKKKIRKLEQKIRKRNNSTSWRDSSPEREDSPVAMHESATPTLQADEWIDLMHADDGALATDQHETTTDVTLTNPASSPQPGPSTTPAQVENAQLEAEIVNLDSNILEILGEDPTTSVKYGPEIRKELASRLTHITTEGLGRDTRTELMSKYNIPSNCAQFDAPKMNLEIKAALPEPAVKRDKGIEAKQKQMTSAISCLSDIINTQLNSKSKNTELLRKLMDATRILCDIQHADSVTRRNFILFSLKNDMKDHLKNTKIDTSLFGENLAEILKSAKAVNKSGIELKAEIGNKKATKKFKPAPPRSGNSRAPPQAYRGVGRAPPYSAAGLGRGAAAPRAPPPPAHSLRTSSQPGLRYQQRRR